MKKHIPDSRMGSGAIIDSRADAAGQQTNLTCRDESPNPWLEMTCRMIQPYAEDALTIIEHMLLTRPHEIEQSLESRQRLKSLCFIDLSSRTLRDDGLSIGCAHRSTPRPGQRRRSAVLLLHFAVVLTAPPGSQVVDAARSGYHQRHARRPISSPAPHYEVPVV
jgi:hypothetical protein